MKSPFAGQQDAFVTRPVGLTPAAADELARVARFALVLLHELRTPLTSAISSLGSLKDLTPPSEGIKVRLIENALESAQMIRRRTDDAMDITLFRSGIAHLDMKPFSVAELVARVTEDYQAQARARNVQLFRNVDAGLPPLVADERRLDQVLRHFIRNALEYAASGRRIDVRARRVEDSVVIEVQDYGPGIDPMRRMSMLQTDFREELQFGEVAGMGVGLELCKVLLEQHGGRITVTTEKGQGSRFAAEVPVRNPVPQGRVTPPRGAAADAPAERRP